MSDALALKIVTPYRLLVRTQAEEVYLPGACGQMGVLPGHAPLVSALGIGELHYRDNGGEHRMAVAGGFVEVEADEITVLAETGELAEEIDRARAKAAKERAERALTRPDLSEEEFEAISAALLRALTRLLVGGSAG